MLSKIFQTIRSVQFTRIRVYLGCFVLAPFVALIISRDIGVLVVLIFVETYVSISLLALECQECKSRLINPLGWKFDKFWQKAIGANLCPHCGSRLR